MGALISGLFIGCLIAGLFGCIGGIIHSLLYEEISELICKIVTTVLCVTSIIFITFGTCNYTKLQSSCYIERYNTTKQTMEESLRNDNISGMERLQLVQSAIDENKYLVQEQFDCQQWYGFLIDDDVLNLEPIDFN